jgi:sporulation protein YlmC with PRC-barrel domain
MSKHILSAMLVAATALTSLPVVAQTAASGSSSSTPNMAATPSAPTTPSMVTKPSAAPTPSMAANPNSVSGSSTSTSSSATYYTADQQLRASKLVGASVYDSQGHSIGSVDNVLLGDADHKAGMAVISVGGFLGVDAKLVSVPFDQLKIQDNKVVMPGATKASLESMPDYAYNKA